MKIRTDFVTNSSSSSFIVRTNDSLENVQEYVDALNKTILERTKNYDFEYENGYTPAEIVIPKKLSRLMNMYNSYFWGVANCTINHYRALTGRKNVTKKAIKKEYFYDDDYEYSDRKKNAAEERKYLNNIWIFTDENVLNEDEIESIINKFNARYQHLG